MKSIHHSFDTDLAAKYGVHEAILIHHFQHWISINKKLKRNFKEGRTWSYQTIKEIGAHFHYLTTSQILIIICNLVDEKVLMKGNFNKTKFDRTCWYAFVDECDFLNNVYDCVKPKMEEREVENGKEENLKPIPDPLTDTETDPPPLPPPTPEEEEEISKRFKERPKGSPRIVSKKKWEETVLADIRDENKRVFVNKIYADNHKSQSIVRDGCEINGDRVVAGKDAVEFNCGRTSVKVPYDISDEDWKKRTERWFGSKK